MKSSPANLPVHISYLCLPTVKKQSCIIIQTIYYYYYCWYLFTSRRW